MKTIERIEVPRLPPDGRPRIVGFGGDYLGHREPCDNPEQYKVRYRGANGIDVVKTFEKEKQ